MNKRKIGVRKSVYDVYRLQLLKHIHIIVIYVLNIHRIILSDNDKNIYIILR